MVFHLPKFQVSFPPFVLLMRRITSLKSVEHLHLKSTGKERKFLQEELWFPKANIYKPFDFLRKV